MINEKPPQKYPIGFVAPDVLRRPLVVDATKAFPKLEKAALLLSAVFLIMLSGCAGYVETPRPAMEMIEN